MTMLPDYTAAATRATETLITHRITAAPVAPLPILKSLPNVIVVSFAEMALNLGTDRDNVLNTFPQSQDAVTSTKVINGSLKYVVAYNQRLPFYLMQRSLARELGHIIMQHDGSRPDEVRTEEAACFARHLLCPRPLVRAIQESGIKLTVEVFGNVTGCYERCLAGIRRTPGTAVPAVLNKMLRDQFADYINNLAIFKAFFANEDDTPPVDFGTYMDEYEE